VFVQALTEIVRRLDEAKARGLVDQYALIGGFAVSAWGIPRATHDIDFVLALGSAEAASLAAHLHAEFHAGESDDPLRGVFRMSVTVDHLSVPVQLVLLPPAWNTVVFAHVESLPVFGCTVRVVSWQALILLKLYAGGPQDLLDARQILAVRQATQAERRSLAVQAEAVGLSAAWQAFIAG
jgi:Nucleotidyl transferase AbiEii toxin, Type IV TA system